jgi:hypothetical protein
MMGERRNRTVYRNYRICAYCILVTAGRSDEKLGTGHRKTGLSLPTKVIFKTSGITDFAGATSG